MATSKGDCFVQHGLVDDKEGKPHPLKELIEQKASEYSDLSQKEARIQAVKDLQEKTLDNLQDVYKQVGLPGHEPRVEINPNQLSKPKELIPADTSKGNINEVGANEKSPPETGNTQQPEKEETGKTKLPEDDEKVTGVKKAISETTRIERSLPKVDLPKMGSDVENLQKAKQRIDNGESNPMELVNRILDDKGGFRNEDEVFDMQYYAHQLASHENDLREQLHEAKTESEEANISGQLQQLSDEVDRQTEAAQTALNKWSKIGNASQVVIDTGFNPSREKLFIKDAYGGDIPKDVQDKLDSVIKERDNAIAQQTKLEEELKQKEANLRLAEMKKDVSTPMKGNPKEKRAQLFEDLKNAKKEHEDWLKENGIKQSGIGFTLTGKMIKIIGRIASTYIEEGYQKLDDIISNIHDDVKGYFAGITKKDIRDAIALHESDRLNKKAEGLEDKINSGTVQNPISKLKLKIQNNSDWVKANQRVYNAESSIRKIKSEAFESQKNMYQKGLMWASKLIRGSVLSGLNVLYKLGAAASIGGAAKRIPEQGFGALWSQVFKGIAQKAPIEGFWNAKAEAKFYKEFFNPAKFVKNSIEIAKTHSSLLNKKMGETFYDDMAEITMPGSQKTVAGKIAKTALNVVDRTLSFPLDVHQMIKDPVKRATYESSYLYGLVNAEKNGLDISNPLVINSIENAAYKRANYEIFQEKNTKKLFGKISNPATAVNQFKNAADKSGNAGSTAKVLSDFLIPVSTVPTNIAKRVLTTSPLGLIRGGYKVVEAYRKGISNLSNEEADATLRQLKQGTLGTGLWLLGWFGASSFGGLYSQYNPNKKRDEGELLSDQMEVNGEMIPKPAQHALPLEIIQMAATARHIFDHYSKKGSSDFESIYHSGLGSIGALTEQIPVLETGAHILGAATSPYEAKKLEDDMKRRFEPQLLKETGIIKSDKKEAVKPQKTSTEGMY